MVRMSRPVRAEPEHKGQPKKPPFTFEGGFRVLSRQRPTLPRGRPRSTIGAGGLNFCVRDGNRCFPSAIAAGKHGFSEFETPTTESGYDLMTSRAWEEEVCGQASRPISTGQLSVLPHLHIRPINLVVFEGSSVPMFPSGWDISS